MVLVYTPIKLSVNNKFPIFFRFFIGNSLTQKPNKSQTKQANTTGVQYFPRFWSCLREHEQEWRQLIPIVFILSLFYFLIICANFRFRLRLRQSTLPPTEYTPPLVWSVMQNCMTALPPDCQTSPIRRGRHTLPLLTSLPTTVPQGIHRHC